MTLFLLNLIGVDFKLYYHVGTVNLFWFLKVFLLLPLAKHGKTVSTIYFPLWFSLTGFLKDK